MSRLRRSLRPLIVGLVVVAATLAVRRLDVRQLMGDDIKGDWATYVAMALSVADDGDLRYEPGDYTRFVRSFPGGPSGIFLKKRYDVGLDGKTAVSTSQSLAFGKPLIYSLAAAPFVAIGGVAGMLVFNAVLLGLCLYCGARFCRVRAGPWAALLGIAFIVATAVPVYATWLTSEIFNFTLVFVAYFLWLYKKVAPADTRGWLMRPSSTVVAALLLGVATYSKGTNAVLVGPLVLDAIVRWRVRESAALVLAFLIGSLGLFGVNYLVTGEANYQGGDRRSFVNHYPFDADHTPFDAKGSAMATNDADTGRVLSSQAIAQIPINVFYFFVGRDGGFVPYYFPGIVILLLWFGRIRRAPLWQWSTCLAVAGSAAALLVFFPDSWNGGGGAPGNRYFLSLYAPLLFLVPAGVGVWPGLVATAGGLSFVGAMVAHPFVASAKPWENIERAPLRWLPVELTLINDLPPMLLAGLRGAVRFVPEPTVQAFYMDAHTYSAEGDGFWIAGDATAETIFKTDLPPTRVKLTFNAPIDNEVWGTFKWGPFAGQSINVSHRANQPNVIYVIPREGFRYHQNYAYVLHLTTRHNFVPAVRFPPAPDTRNLGVFVQVNFFYDELK